MDIHGSFFQNSMVAPDFVQQLATREHTLGMRNQKPEQLEFSVANFNRLFVNADPTTDRINRQRPRLHRQLCMLRHFATYEGFDTRSEFARRKRFGDVIIGALIKPRDLVLFHAFCSQHDHRQRVEITITTDTGQ